MANDRINISDTRKLRDSLLKNEDKYRTLIETTDTGFVILDQNGLVLDANPEYVRFTGHHDLSEIVGRSVIEWTVDSEKEKNAAALKAVLKKRYIRNLEINYVNSKGCITPIEINATCVEIDGKKQIVTICHNISGRKKTEEALRQSEKRYRLLAEIAEDPIFIVGKTGLISYVNTFGAAYLGKKPTDMIGSHIFDFFPSKLSARMMKNIRKVFKSNRAVFTFGEFDFHGSKFWLDTRLSPLTDYGGKVTHVMGISRDMTSHRRAEEILERDKRELEKLIKINSQKLLDSQKRLDRADRLAYIGTIAATVAHELRSPLAAIRIAAYNIKMKSKNPHLNSNIRNIEIKVVESDQIIKNLLLYSSIKSPIREKVKVCDLLSGSIDLAQSLFPGHSVRIRRILKCSYDMMLVADPVQLQEVFNNILNNSFESFDNKKGEIEVSASVDTGDRFKIIIKDNGPGIGPEALEHIFEPFNSTKAGGTGLGLPVCKQIINLHKGSMDVSSRLGKGTTVTIRLPLGNNKSIVMEKSKKACLPAGREGA